MTEVRPKSTGASALLVLEDGTSFLGRSCGAPGETHGEIVFNTSMTGYQEILTDPSYAGQIITMTFPHIGIYGTNLEDMESRGVFASGLVVRALSETVSNWRAKETLPEFLDRHGVVAIEGIDTRRLTRRVREAGAMRAVLSTIDLDSESLRIKALASPSLVGRDLAGATTTPATYLWGTESPAGSSLPADTGLQSMPLKHRVAVLDSGVKYNIARSLSAAGCEVMILPASASSEEVLALEPDGIFFSNGPGDPAALEYLYETLRVLLGQKPIFGICLGHQMLCLALGARTYKLKYGHRGGNQPVKNLLTDTVEVTSQNHGFCVDFESIGPLIPEESGGLTFDPGDIRAWVRAGIAPVVRSANHGRVQLTHVNLNDMTVAGIRALDIPAFSVQYHPEAAPGPHDARYLFEIFVRLMDGLPTVLSATDGE